MYVAAQLDHSSSTTTLNHYAHVYADAQMAPARRMVDAISEAREAWGVRPEFANGKVRVLRQAL